MTSKTSSPPLILFGQSITGRLLQLEEEVLLVVGVLNQRRV